MVQYVKRLYNSKCLHECMYRLWLFIHTMKIKQQYAQLEIMSVYTICTAVQLVIYNEQYSIYVENATVYSSVIIYSLWGAGLVSVCVRWCRVGVCLLVYVWKGWWVSGQQSSIRRRWVDLYQVVWREEVYSFFSQSPQEEQALVRLPGQAGAVSRPGEVQRAECWMLS